MDLTVLPTLCGLAVFVFCFRPLVRRAGPHTNAWFIGWTFLLIHYVFVMLPVATGLRASIVDFLCTGASELCGLCFILAASNVRASRSNRLLMLAIGGPILLQCFWYAFQVHRLALGLMATLLMLMPALYLLLVSRERSRAFNHVAVALALLAAGETGFIRANPDVVVNVTLCALFLVAAYFTFLFAAKLSRGLVLMGGGLVVWALCYPLQSTGWLHINLHLTHAVLDVPRYAAAGGMILSLLDEYLSKAESLALHDPLTGLPNRRLFDIRLDQAIRESQMTQTPIACLVIDVDKFKYINDTFGHPVGDGLLQALAKRLSWNLGPRDMLARTGGDEFTAILVEAADEYHVRFIAGAMMAAGCVPVSIQQHLIDVRISIGIAVAPQDAIDTAELHRVADEAMYRAKRRGGGGVSFSHEELEQIHAV